MTAQTTTTPRGGGRRPGRRPGRRRRDLGTPRRLTRGQAILQGIVLTIGAIAFLFPFYYMLVGSLQSAPDTSAAGAFPNPANLTLNNYVQINSRINLLTGLVNSGIFTGGVLLFTVVFGVLAGYSLAVLQWRGRGVTFALALLVQTVPFQLLMIPLYVLIARNYGLADNYLGMILPFAINSAAVLIFRQYFLQLPRELFDAARVDGAGEFQLLWRVALADGCKAPVEEEMIRRIAGLLHVSHSDFIAAKLRAQAG